MIACEIFSDRKILCSRLSPLVRHRLSDWHSEAISIGQLGGTLSTIMNTLPDSLQEPVKNLVVVSPGSRWTAERVLQSSFFNSGPVATIRNVQGLLDSNDDVSKICEFLTKLPAQLEPFPSSVLKQLILPSLLSALRNPALAPYALPAVIQVGKKLKLEDFSSLILPGQ